MSVDALTAAAYDEVVWFSEMLDLKCFQLLEVESHSKGFTRICGWCVTSVVAAGWVRAGFDRVSLCSNFSSLCSSCLIVSVKSGGCC